MASEIKFGRELKLGDMIKTWFGRQRLVATEPYKGPIDFSRFGGAFIGVFDSGIKMTMTSDWDYYEVIIG